MDPERIVRLFCNECGRRQLLTGQPPEGKSLAEFHGWMVNPGGGHSVCPSCRARAENPK
jgi:hypothetical protein